MASLSLLSATHRSTKKKKRSLFTYQSAEIAKKMKLFLQKRTALDGLLVEEIMQEHTKQKLAFANDSVKQLITLSTAILTLTVAFKDKVFPSPHQSFYWLLVLALLSQIFSVYSGVRALQGFVNVLEIANNEDEPSVYTPQIVNPAKLQITFFIIGLSLLVAYLAASIFG